MSLSYYVFAQLQSSDIAVLFVIAKDQKQPKCLLLENSLNKLWYILIKEYFSVEYLSVMR